MTSHLLTLRITLSEHNWTILRERRSVFPYMSMDDRDNGLAPTDDDLRFVREYLAQSQIRPDPKCYLLPAPSLNLAHRVMEQFPDPGTTTKGVPGRQVNHDRCGALYSMMNGKADGTVFPCCMHPQAMGNLNESTLPEIWNSGGYKALRRQHATGDVDDMCGRCFDGLRYVTKR